MDEAGRSILDLDKELSREIAVNISAPGKVILHGEHSVVYGKLAIAASIGLRTRVNLQQNSIGDGVSLQLEALNLTRNYCLDDIQKLVSQPLPVSKNLNFNLENPNELDHDALLKRVEHFIDKNVTFPFNHFQKLALFSLFYLFYGIFGSLNIPIKSLRIVIETDLTISSGTGSSASYLVALAAAFYQYIRLRVAHGEVNENLSREGYKGYNLHFNNVRKFEKHELELISKWAYCAERIIHGTPSGVDNTTCTFGSMVKFRKEIGSNVVDLSSKFKILLINTKVPRETKAMVARVAALRQRHNVVVNTMLDAMNTIAEDALEYFLTISDTNKTKPNEERLKDLYERLWELVDLNQNLLRALQVSHPKLDHICRILMEYGLRGKLTGAGGGGYAIAVVPPYLEDTAIWTLISKLECEGYQVALTDLGGPGVTID